MAPSDLGQRLTAHGFASNADYRYPVHCALSAPIEQLRCIIVEGEAGRRKTAFANTPANSLDYDHVLYPEFTTRPEPRAPVRIAPPPEEEEGVGEPPVDELDRIVSEACAHSEGEPTVLILDQLSKFWIMARFEEYEVLTVWPVFNLTLVYNTGAAFSFLSDASGWQRWFFVVLALVITLVLVVWLSRLGRHERVVAGVLVTVGV